MASNRLLSFLHASRSKKNTAVNQTLIKTRFGRTVVSFVLREKSVLVINEQGQTNADPHKTY
jgi:hypothetical protein